MKVDRPVVKLLIVLPLLAGGIVGCETAGKTPGGATVPIGGGTGQGGAAAQQQPAREAPAQAAPREERPRQQAQAQQPAREQAREQARPAASTAAMTGGSVAFYPTGRREDSALMVEKIAPSEVAAGAATEYMIKVTNLTNMTLDNVTVNETIPQGFTVSGTDPAGSNGVFNVGRLNGGESRTITVRGAFAQAGSYGSCATASYTIPVCMTVNVVSPALRLTKTSPAETLLCDGWEVKLVVTNSGTGTARNVVIRDELPQGVTTTDGRNAVEFTVPALAGGQSREFTFPVRAQRVGSYSNDAQARADGGLTATSANVTTQVKAPTLTLTKACPTGRIFPGRPGTFNITVTNTGNAVSANTVVRDPIPAGATFVSATEGGAVQGGAVVWNVGNLNPGQSKTVSVTMNLNAGTIANTATATGVCATDVNAGCQVTIQGVPDIGTGIDDNDGVVTVGNTHTFVFTVVNQGQIELTNVTVDAQLDEGLEFTSTNLPGAAAISGRSATFRVGNLPVGQRRSFNIVVTGTSEGDKLIRTTTKSDQTREARNDEQVNYVPR